MLTLSYGYKKPQLDDTGDVFFPALEQNFQQLNDHIHDGATSAILPNATQNILAAGWALVAGFLNLYSQTVTLPGVRLYDSTTTTFKLSDGTRIYPTVKRVSTTQYQVFVNDPTLVLIAEYSS